MAFAVTSSNRLSLVRGIVIAYPLVVFVIASAINVAFFDIVAFAPGLPPIEVLLALSAATVLLIINHSWLMTSTELTRVRYGIKTTPEEWNAADVNREDIDAAGFVELERRHNAHRNTTENTVYFALLAGIVALTSTHPAALCVWVYVFPIARLGYTFGYLNGYDGVRGLSMTISLLAMYGLTSVLVLGALAAIV